MELSVREWMIIIGALLIVAVLLDGYRRIRNENRHRIKVSLSRQAYRQALNPSPAVVEEVESRGPNPELPNGGARVIGKRKASLQLDQPVPVLLESVEIPPQPADELAVSAAEPVFDSETYPRDIQVDADSRDIDYPQADESEPDEREPEQFAPAPQRFEPLTAQVDDDALFEQDETVEPQHTTYAAEPLFAADAMERGGDESVQHGVDARAEAPSFAAPAIESPASAVDVKAARAAQFDGAEEHHDSLHEKRVGLWDDEPEPEVEEVEERRSPWHGFSFRRRDAQPSESVRPEIEGGTQEVLAIYVVARDGEPFKGQDLLQLLLACDLRFGKMNIFHRHEKPNGRGAVQFSVANIAEPGTFNLDRIDEFSTAGVCLFLVLPGPEAPYKAFDYMVETAQVLVKHLDGELRDDAHSALTRQTLEHCRQRIRDFERKQLTLHL